MRPARGRGDLAWLPCGTGIGSLQVLQFGQQIAEVFGVTASSAAGLHPAIGGARQRGPRQDCVDSRIPRRVQPRRIRDDARVDVVAADKQFTGIGPKIVQRCLGAAVAFPGAIAQADQPFRRMPQMIGRFLFGLCGRRGNRAVGRRYRRAPEPSRQPAKRASGL